MFHSLHLHRAALALLCLSASVVYGQFVSGSIGGRIVDPTGAPVAEADIKLIHSQTGRISSAKSNSTGEFQFPAVPSGEYNVQIEKTGFQTFERRNTNLSANERLSLGDIVLVLGSVTERVVVEAESTPVQTASSERSAQLTSNQINKIMTRGRDVMSLMRLLPGVAYTADSESVGDNLGTALPNVQGGRK